MSPVQPTRDAFKSVTSSSKSHGNRSRLTQPDSRNAIPASHPVADVSEPQHKPFWSPTRDATPVPPVASTAFHRVLLALAMGEECLHLSSPAAPRQRGGLRGEILATQGRVSLSVACWFGGHPTLLRSPSAGSTLGLALTSVVSELTNERKPVRHHFRLRWKVFSESAFERERGVLSEKRER